MHVMAFGGEIQDKPDGEQELRWGTSEMGILRASSGPLTLSG